MSEKFVSTPTTSSNINSDFNNDFMYILIDNIPVEYHTPDLRNFFSYSIENETFEVFNYRHRPNPNDNKKANMCICKIKSNKYDELLKLYDKKNWINVDGLIHKNKCSIIKIKLSKHNKEKNTDDDLAVLDQNELTNLLEFKKIPDWMKNGNVGTPTRVFIDYINQAIMPVSLITKLGINLKAFKKNKKKKYAYVKYDYEKSYENDETQSNVELDKIDVARTANGINIDEELDDEKEIKKINSLRINEKNQNNYQNDNENEKDEDEDEDADGDIEEWERHEALHDDVAKQDRTSPYFFEHEIELQWEKGGSGLVFYTDDNFWKDLDNKDFDGETADDLDIDMSGYYDPQANLDKDSQDIIDMNREEFLRKGAEQNLINDESKRPKLNPFHSKIYKCSEKFGRKQLMKLGWKDGDTIGLRNNGLLEPLDGTDNGKVPNDKTGLGYHGEKVDRDKMIQIAKQKRLIEYRNSPYFIGSKFDSNKTEDSLLRRYDPTIKYRSQK